MRTLLSWSSGEEFGLGAARAAAAAGCGRRRPGDDDQCRVRPHRHARRPTHLGRGSDRRGPPAAVSWRCPIPAPTRSTSGDGRVVSQHPSSGVDAMAFGDLFLEDIRRYRERQLAGTGLTPLFPLWGLETGRWPEMVDGGLAAYVACVDPRTARALRRAPLRCELLPTCPRGSTPAASMANSTPSPTPGRCSVTPFRSRRRIVARDGFVFAT